MTPYVNADLDTGKRWTWQNLTILSTLYEICPETIQDVRGRIESSGSTYAGNESRTRYGLIDPSSRKVGLGCTRS